MLRPDAEADAIEGVHEGLDVGLGGAAAGVALGGGIGDASGAQGVEVDLVVAEDFDVLEALSTGEDVERDVEDVVGFVVGEMALEEVEVVVDVADQADPVCQQGHGADAAGGEALGAAGRLIVDVGGGDHGPVALGSGPILDAVEDPAPTLAEDPAVAFPGLVAAVIPGLLAVVFSGLLGESRSHSKVSVVWKSEDVILPPLFQELRGFSSFFRDFDAEALYITLG